MGTKVAVVTGGNKGIGYGIVKRLCSKFQGDVILTARDEGRGRAAVEELKKEGFNPKFHLLDIECLDSIRKLKEYLEKEYGGLDVLVNNAGIAYKWTSAIPLSEQGEKIVKVNYFSTLNVCRELFPLLRPHARVVNVSSSQAKLSKIPSQELRSKFSDPNLTEEAVTSLIKQFLEDLKAGVHKDKGWSSSAYQMAKIGLTALTFIHQRAFQKDSRGDIVTNSVHPGLVATDLSSHKGPLTPDQGAEAPVYLALLPPHVESPKGEYVWNDKTIASWL